MQSGFKNYEGIASLDNLREAKNYNNLFENYLFKFLGNEKEVVDFGAGNGEFADRLQKRGIKVFCVEIDPEYFKNLDTRNYETMQHISDFKRQFACIYSFHVLEHIENDIKALEEIKAALKPGGRFFICVPASMLIYSHFDSKIGHFRRYSKKELRGKLENAGFKVNKIYYLDSLGFLAIYFFKLFSKAGNEPSINSIRVYDRYIFPLSLVVDKIFSRFIGRHLVAYAQV